jgi:zinc transport system substrate-binding protein
MDMSFYRLMLVATGLWTVLWLGGCGDKNETAENEDATDGPFEVFVVNYPLRYFTERIAGDLVVVHFPAPTDIDPAYWSPDNDVLANCQAADLILINGAGYASWLDKVSLPTARMVNTCRGLEDRLILITEQLTHSHGPGAEHAHAGFAFTTWLDFSLALEQARKIKEALAVRLPEHRDRFEAGFQSLENDLLALDKRMADLVVSTAARPVIFSHPVYQYLENRYGLAGSSLHWEPGEAPNAKMWRDLEAILAEHPARWMIWEGAPLPATAQRLDALGVTGLVFSPCGNTPEKGDFLSVMNANITALQVVFE